MVEFATDRESVELISQIADIALKAKSLAKVQKIDLMMDLQAAHEHRPLDLEKLLQWGKDDTFDFWHDVYGVMRHIDRTTGEMQNCFLPRCATRQGG